MAVYYIRTGGNDANDGLTTGTAWLTFQFGLNTIVHGDTLDVEAGMTFSNGGTPFTVPFKAGGTDTIADLKTVRSSAYLSLPEKITKVNAAAQAANMFKLVATDVDPVLKTATIADNPKWWKFVGMECTNSGVIFNNGLISVGGAFSPTTAPSDYASTFYFDKCYVHPQEHGTTNYKRTSQYGFLWNAGAIEVTNSCVDGFWGIYGDAASYRTATIDTGTDIISFGGTPITFFYLTNTVIVFSTGSLPSPLTTDPDYYFPVGTRGVTDAVTNSTTTVTSATMTFTAGDVGKQYMITDGTNYSTGWIATYVSATEVTVTPYGAAITWTGTGNTLSLFANDNTIKLSATRAGTPINLTTAGTGTVSIMVPEPINSGAFWTNGGGPYLLDNNHFGANYNPFFLGAGAAGSANEGTVEGTPTLTSVTLSDTTGIVVGTLIAFPVHYPVWSPTVFLYQAATATGATDTIIMDDPYDEDHGLLNDDVLFVESATLGFSGPNTRYYVVNKTTADFQLSLTRGGSPVNITGDGPLRLGLAGHAWATGLVSAVNHGTGVVTLEYMARFEGYGQTPQLDPPFDYVETTALPLVGAQAKWNGYHVEDLTVTHNTVELDSASCIYVFNRTGSKPKAFAEVKDLHTALFEGNIYQGWPSIVAAFILASQNGTSPWATIRDVTIRNNFCKNTSVFAFIQISTAPPADHGDNVVIENNLSIGNATFGMEAGPGWVLSGVGGGRGTPLIMRHNTFVNEAEVFGGYLFTSGGIALPFVGSGGAIIEDNIMWWNTNGVQLGLNETYFPNLVEANNLLVDNDSIGQATVITANFANSLYAEDTAAVDFAGGGAGTDPEDWRLLATSPGFEAATDNTDVGVDVDALLAALAGGLQATSTVEITGQVVFTGGVVIS